MGALQPRQLLLSLVAGLITGIIAVMIATASGVLIFSGHLPAYVPAGIGLMLFGSLVVAGLIALTSSFRGLVAGIQENAVALLVVISSAIVQAMPSSATTQETFVTVVAAISVASLLTGATFLLLGQFKLGNLIRYIPYPVIGGFLAGSGLLLALYAISFMAGVEVSLFRLSPLVQGDALIRWLPGLILAAALLVVSRRCDNCLIMPGLLLAAFVVFYGALWLTNTSIPAATAQGWLIDMLPKGGGRLWPPMGPADVQLVNWSVLGRQMGGLAAVAIINVVSILLNITGIELAAGQDIDLNHELKAAGFSNLVAGLGGGGVGCHVLGDSILAHRIGARSRLVGVFLAAVCGAVLLVGGSLLSYFPSPVLGGLLLFLGLDFLVEWIYEAWFRLPKIDCLVVILIMLAIYQVGVLEGVGLGVALAVVVFIVDYSRVDVIRHALSGITCRSNIERPRLYRQLLSQKGDWLYILELQGFIFFGTANKLLDRVRRRMDDPDLPAPRFIVLDFRLVSGLDSSAVLSFARMKQLAQRQGVTLILTHLAPQMRRQLGGEVLDEPKDERDGAVLTFPDLDHGVEWCEEQMIRTFEDVGLAAKAKTLRQQLEEFLPVSSRATNLLAQLEEARSTSSIIARVWARLDEEDRTQLERAQPLSAGDIDLMDYLERGEVGTGHYLIRQGDEPKALYFIETGQVTIQLESRDERHRVVRLRTMGAGTIVGEIGLYLGRLTTASVVTDQPTTFYRLSADNLARMEETAPEIAAAFHKFIVCLLGERLADANAALEALVD